MSHLRHCCLVGLLILAGSVRSQDASPPRAPQYIEVTLYQAVVIGNGTIEGADQPVPIGPERHTKAEAEADEASWKQRNPKSLRLTDVRERTVQIPVNRPSGVKPPEPPPPPATGAKPGGGDAGKLIRIRGYKLVGGKFQREPSLDFETADYDQASDYYWRIKGREGYSATWNDTAGRKPKLMEAAKPWIDVGAYNPPSQADDAELEKLKQRELDFEQRAKDLADEDARLRDRRRRQAQNQELASEEQKLLQALKETDRRGLELNRAGEPLYRTADELAALKARLETQRQQLGQEAAALEAAGRTARTQGAIDALNRRIRDHSARVKDWTAASQQFNSLVEQINRQLEEHGQRVDALNRSREDIEGQLAQVRARARTASNDPQLEQHAAEQESRRKEWNQERQRLDSDWKAYRARTPAAQETPKTK